MEESKPETYTFSEPRVVLTVSNGAFESIEWLPDNQRALVFQRVIENRNVITQTMELFNPRTVKVQVYAKSNNKSAHSGLPLWVAGLNAIIYPEYIHSSSSDANGIRINSSVVVRELLRLSQGTPDDVLNIKDIEYKPYVTPHGWTISSIAVKPDGSQIVYSANNGESISRLYSRTVLHEELGKEQLLPVDIPQFKSGDYLFNYRMTWRPNTSQLFFYHETGTRNLAGTVLLDINSGKSCTLDFGAWIHSARWSPNGRYLAVTKSIEAYPALSTNIDLNILDTTTGKIYQIDSTKIESPVKYWRRLIADFSWAPDNRHLIFIGTADTIRTGTGYTFSPIRRLYLVDFLSGEVDNLFPSFQLYSWDGLAWSPDGTKILVNCPVEEIEKLGRLCYIPVHVGGD